MLAYYTIYEINTSSEYRVHIIYIIHTIHTVLLVKLYLRLLSLKCKGFFEHKVEDLTISLKICLIRVSLVGLI